MEAENNNLEMNSESIGIENPSGILSKACKYRRKLNTI
jgi:hypothetical protein